jgi:hypothetical protein
MGVLTRKKNFLGVIVLKDGRPFSPFWGSVGAEKICVLVVNENRLGAKIAKWDMKVRRIVEIVGEFLETHSTSGVVG